MELSIEFEKRVVDLEKRYLVKNWNLPNNSQVDKLYLDEGGMIDSSFWRNGGLEDDIIVINNKSFLVKNTHISEEQFEEIGFFLRKSKRLYKTFEIRTKRKEKLNGYAKDAIEKEEEKLKQNWNGTAKI